MIRKITYCFVLIAFLVAPLWAQESLVERSPFLPPGYNDQPPAPPVQPPQRPLPPSQIQFNGFEQSNGTFDFAISDRSQNPPKFMWLSLGESNDDGYSILSFNDSDNTLTVKDPSGRSHTIAMAAPITTPQNVPTNQRPPMPPNVPISTGSPSDFNLRNTTPNSNNNNEPRRIIRRRIIKPSNESSNASPSPGSPTSFNNRSHQAPLNNNSQPPNFQNSGNAAATANAAPAQTVAYDSAGNPILATNQDQVRRFLRGKVITSSQ